jgi:ATP-dependent helicase YprA (DUF1998 family)
MTAEGHTVASLTGGIEGSMRDKLIDDFRDGRAKVLITTNVLSRGIDVSTVSMVVNYVRGLARLLHFFHSNISLRIFPNFTSRVNNARRILRRTSTVSVVPVVSAALVSPSRLSPAARNGRC